MQKETPQPAPDNGFFQREPAREIAIPGDNRLVRSASSDPAPPARTAQPGEPMVIPVRLDGSVKEIVLRIVIEQSENADQRR
jgi:hypothetical protein